MRVALVHSFYSGSAPSGENIAVKLQLEALERAGVDARLVAVWTDDLRNRPLYSVKTALNTMVGNGEDPRHALDRLNPDIVHIHNLFPNFGTKWLASIDRPTIATVHNLRALCAAGTMSRDGRACSICPDRGNSLAAVRHRCYRNSVLGSCAVAVRTWGGVRNDAVLKAAKKLVFQSARALRTYLSYGLEKPERVQVISNFVEANQGYQQSGDFTRPWLYAGRLSSEKGIVDLLERWPKGQPLRVIGDGPQREMVERLAVNGVQYLGPRNRDDLLAMLPGSRGLLFPSLCAEGMPTIYLEALAAGVPVIGTRSNSAGDDIVSSGAGAILDLEGDILGTLRQVESSWARYSRVAHERYLTAFSEGAWARRILAAYSGLLGRGTGAG